MCIRRRPTLTAFRSNQTLTCNNNPWSCIPYPSIETHLFDFPAEQNTLVGDIITPCCMGYETENQIKPANIPFTKWTAENPGLSIVNSQNIPFSADKDFRHDGVKLYKALSFVQSKKSQKKWNTVKNQAKKNKLNTWFWRRRISFQTEKKLTVLNIQFEGIIRLNWYSEMKL